MQLLMSDCILPMLACAVIAQYIHNCSNLPITQLGYYPDNSHGHSHAYACSLSITVGK